MSVGCNRPGDVNEETSVIISDIVCGVNNDVTITPFNSVGDGVNSNVSFPGMTLKQITIHEIHDLYRR